MGSEPTQSPMLQFCGSNGYSAAVVSAGDFQEFDLRIRELDSAGVAHGDIAVNLAVGQEYWNACVSDCVLPASVEMTKLRKKKGGRGRPPPHNHRITSTYLAANAGSSLPDLNAA